MSIKIKNATAASQATANRVYVRDDVLSVETVERALVGPGGMTQHQGWERYVGGVYRSDGSVVEASLIRRAGGWCMRSPPPEPLRRDAQDVDAEAVYGGILIHHFGHFTLESTARLWWIVESGFQGPVVFQATYPDLMRTVYIRDYFRLLGLGDRIVLVDRPMRFKRLHVPEAALEIRSHVHPSFVLPFRKIADRVAAEVPAGARPVGGTGGRRLYLSRTQLNTGIAIGETEIEARFRKSGYAIVRPETLPLAAQIGLLMRAERVAGLTGSAFHNLLYCEPKSAFYIGRSQQLNANYPMIDQLLGTDAVYFMGPRKPRAQPKHGNIYVLDPQIVIGELEAEGWLAPERRQSAPRDLKRQVLAERELQAATGARQRGGRDLLHPGVLRRLLLAAALRPGDTRTLKALIAAFIARRRFQVADRFALEVLTRSEWDEALASELASMFAIVGQAGVADRLIKRGEVMRAQAVEQDEWRSAHAAPRAGGGRRGRKRVVVGDGSAGG